MPFIKTKSYNLAVYERGNPDATKCAIVLPGRLESKDYIHIQSHVDLLATLGFHALAFDPPGSWESSGNIASYTVTNYLGAVNAVIEYYGNKPTLLVGHSLGGSIAMLAAANNPHVAAFITLMALANPKVQDREWRAAGKITFYRDLPPGDHTTSEQRQYDLPYSFLEDSRRYNTQSALQHCHKPKLCITGTYDTQNSPRYSPDERAHIAEPKQFIEVPSYHSYRYSQAGIDTINTIIKRFVLSLPSYGVDF
jgi:pimeloyl-ACP methyl ester carboxylesterase